MRDRIRAGLVVAAVALAAPGAFAQDFKTPPLQQSETFSLPFSYHPTPPPWAGWAGWIVKLHLLDASELDLTVHPNVPTRTPSGTFAASSTFSPFGPPSGNLESAPVTYTLWVPNALQSGIGTQTVTPSTLIFHAKDTTLANNSDTDLVTMFWNIYHVRTGPGSTLVALRPSDRIWVSSNITNVGQLHTPASQIQLPPTGPTPFSPDGHWLHIPNFVTLHLTGLGSGFYATLVGSGTYGVEHVPEPTSAFLVGGGLLALALGSRARRRRLRMA
jgi:hypothetical protein